MFYILTFQGACECTWKPRSARNQGRDKRGEIWMSLITCGSIHEGHEWFSNDSRGRQEIFICLAVLLCAILPIREWRRRQDIDQVLLHEIIFFVSVYSAAVKC